MKEELNFFNPLSYDLTYVGLHKHFQVDLIWWDSSLNGKTGLAKGPNLRYKVCEGFYLSRPQG
jgi:hypothetical protein